METKAVAIGALLGLILGTMLGVSVASDNSRASVQRCISAGLTLDQCAAANDWKK